MSTNRQRRLRGHRALVAYLKVDKLSGLPIEDITVAAIDLIADIQHAVASITGSDDEATTCHRLGGEHFQAEKDRGADERPKPAPKPRPKRKLAVRRFNDRNVGMPGWVVVVVGTHSDTLLDVNGDPVPSVRDMDGPAWLWRTKADALETRREILARP